MSSVLWLANCVTDDKFFPEGIYVPEGCHVPAKAHGLDTLLRPGQESTSPHLWGVNFVYATDIRMFIVSQLLIELCLVTFHLKIKEPSLKHYTKYILLGFGVLG